MFASNVIVQNFKGKRQFTVDAIGTDIKYNQMNQQDINPNGQWEADLENLAAYYQSYFVNGISTQLCGAILPLSTVDDEDPKALLSIDDNTLKYGVEYRVTSGWKTWENEQADETNGGGDGAEFRLYLWQPGENDSSGQTISTPTKWRSEFDTGDTGLFGISIGFAMWAMLMTALF